MYFWFCWLFFREMRERELEYFLKKKYNKLGSKFISRVKTLDNLKTDPNLILKWIKWNINIPSPTTIIHIYPDIHYRWIFNKWKTPQIKPVTKLFLVENKDWSNRISCYKDIIWWKVLFYRDIRHTLTDCKSLPWHCASSMSQELPVIIFIDLQMCITKCLGMNKSLFPGFCTSFNVCGLKQIYAGIRFSFSSFIARPRIYSLCIQLTCMKILYVYYASVGL